MSKATENKKLQFENQINILNDLVKFKVGISKVHGVGLIAMRDIKKGEKLNMDAVFHQFDLPYKKFKYLRPDVAEHILERFPLITSGSHFIYPYAILSAFCNHSDDPNYDCKTDKTTRKIKEGEEIFEDYRQIEGWEIALPWLKK